MKDSDYTQRGETYQHPIVVRRSKLPPQWSCRECGNWVMPSMRKEDICILCEKLPKKR